MHFVQGKKMGTRSELEVIVEVNANREVEKVELGASAVEITVGHDQSNNDVYMRANLEYFFSASTHS